MPQVQKSLANAQPSLSLQQVADRWGVDTSEVKECIKTGALAASVLLTDALVLQRGPLTEWYERFFTMNTLYDFNVDGTVPRLYLYPGAEPREHLNGCRRIPTKEAVAILAAGLRCPRRPIRGMLEVIANEPDQSVVIGCSSLADSVELRVLREELERFEREHSIGELRAEQKGLDRIPKGQPNAPTPDLPASNVPMPRITIGEIAERLKVSKSTVRRRIKFEGLPVRHQAKNSLVGNWDEIMRWLQERHLPRPASRAE